MNKLLAVVIPCYKVKVHILDVLLSIPPFIDLIFVVDDACPQETGKYVINNFHDERVKVIKSPINLGVGGAVILGYCAALEEGADIVIKVDGDGQMNSASIEDLIDPILNSEANYTKGNRFHDIDCLVEMPKIRIFGNAVLSFITKFATGFWDVFDPTNGFTAIDRTTLSLLPLTKIDKRYFFESDILFRLNLARAVVVDVPMRASYKNEISNLKINSIFHIFLYKNLINFCKRIFYQYYLRGMSIASFELPVGSFLIIFGIIYGAINWQIALTDGVSAPLGTIMLSSISILIGLQLLLAFLAYDISSVPKKIIRPNRLNWIHIQK